VNRFSCDEESWRIGDPRQLLSDGRSAQVAHLWFRGSEGEDVWSAMPLNGRAVDVAAVPPRALTEALRLDEEPAVVMVRAESGGASAWVLMLAGDADVRVNGFAPVAGMRVLQDRDEIRIGGAQPLFFSAETLAHIEEFPGAERAVFCGRCRQPMKKGEPAVRCPGCGIWYHQTESLPCWTYAETCGFCPHPTALDAGFGWIPEA
jgi:hypothetical protein